MFAEDAALRMHERERSIVADGADVAEMVGEPLKLGHQRTQIDGARRRTCLQSGFRRLREGKGICDSTVAGGAAGKPCRLFERCTVH